MKTSLLCFLLVSLCLYTCTSDRVELQTLLVDGTSYQVASRSVLNKQLTYLTLREHTHDPANAFLKTQYGVEPTVFSELELRSYLASGNLEDLGKVMTLTQADKLSIRYVVKGYTNVFVVPQNKQLYFMEYKGPVSDLMNPSESWSANQIGQGPGSGQSTQNRNCRINCLGPYHSCLANAKRFPDPIFGLMYKACKAGLNACGSDCDKNYPPQ